MPERASFSAPKKPLNPLDSSVKLTQLLTTYKKHRVERVENNSEKSSGRNGATPKTTLLSAPAANVLFDRVNTSSQSNLSLAPPSALSSSDSPLHNTVGENNSSHSAQPFLDLENPRSPRK